MERRKSLVLAEKGKKPGCSDGCNGIKSRVGNDFIGFCLFVFDMRSWLCSPDGPSNLPASAFAEIKGCVLPLALYNIFKGFFFSFLFFFLSFF